MTLAKVPDARPVNNRYWVFAGDLTMGSVMTCGITTVGSRLMKAATALSPDCVLAQHLL
jgi:hypothetical protein